MRGYTSHQMIEEHKKVSASVSPPPRRQLGTEPVTRIPDPGRADHGSSDQFFQGKHTTAHQRTNILGGIDDRFTPAEVAKFEKQRTQEHQAELQKYIDEVKRSRSDAVTSLDSQKRKDLELLKTYDPWGKPGAGARKEHTGLTSKSKLDDQAAQSAPDTYVGQVMGRQGAGAPVRTDSGKVRAQYTVDGDTQMANIYRSNFGVDAGVRYGAKGKEDDYRKALEAQTAEKSSRVAQERERAAQEAAQEAARDPLGRVPVAAPSPRKKEDPERAKKEHYAKALEQQSREHQERKQREKTEKMAGSDYTPWGKGVGAPERDASGKIVKKAPPPELASEPTIVDRMGKPGGGAPMMEQSGRMSPRKPLEPADAYDPFGRPGAGAPGGNARRTKTTTDMYGGASPTGDSATRQEFLHEQQRLMEEKQQMVERERAASKAETHHPEEFFKFGQGAANPKRDDRGNLLNQRRGQTDIIGMNLDQGGGLGRKQKTDQSYALHHQLEVQAQQRRVQEDQARQAELARDRAHVAEAGSWQGKAGAGAPRRGPNGEVHGRFALDREVHHDEIVDTAKVVPKEDRMRYGEELKRIVEDRTQQAQAASVLAREKSHLHAEAAPAAFGKQGHGAPLRSTSGKVVSQPGRVRDREDTEWRMNARPGRLIE